MTARDPESCNTYNMLRLTEGLFRKDPKAAYADFYERALFNHILSTQHPVHGGYVYFTPARPAHYRVYSAPNEAMWCCVDTGMETMVSMASLFTPTLEIRSMSTSSSPRDSNGRSGGSV